MKVMGIDLGIKKVAYAIWEDGLLTATEAWESAEPMRHHQLQDLGDFIYETAINTFPDLIYIEDTLIGNNRKYSIQLAQTMGSVLSSLGLLSREIMVDIYLVNVSTWKKTVLGNGNAGKDLIKSYVNERHSAYAELCGYDQDRYDAACIGYYGHLISERVDSLRRVRADNGS